MDLLHLKLKKHPILGNLNLSFVNPLTSEIYKIVAFVGENGCGKTTLLNEIFNYEQSEYIIDKQTPYTIVPKPFDALYLRQGSLHKNTVKETMVLLDGTKMYPTNSATYSGGSQPFGMRSNTNANNITEGLKLLEKLGDKEILRLFRDKQISNVQCGGELAKTINGGNGGYDIANYSSGQQEILLKLKDLQSMSAGTDCVLLDEPETSLHPRWQQEIVSLVRLLLTNQDGLVPQIFIATHSEKVLESLISRKDVLIVRLFKKNGVIKAESVDQMDLRLPSPTFAELDYVVFHIPTLEYHDQLLSRFADLHDLETIWEIDKAIKKHEKYDRKQYKKIWISETKKGIVTYKTLPVYIRNYFHHPKKDAAPTEEELVKSILFMRELISSFGD